MIRDVILFMSRVAAEGAGLFGGLFCVIMGVYFRKTLCNLGHKVAILSSVSAVISLSLSLGILAILSEPSPTLCRFGGFVTQIFIGTEDFFVLVLTCLLILPRRTRKLSKTFSLLRLPLTALFCLIAGICAAIPPLFGTAGSYFTEGEKVCWIADDIPASIPMPSHMISICAIFVFLTAALIVKFVRSIRHRRLRNALLGPGKRRPNARSRHVINATEWDDDNEIDDNDSDLGETDDNYEDYDGNDEESTSTDAIRAVDENDDVVNASIMFARKFAAKRKGRFIIVWSLLHIVAGIHGVISAIFSYASEEEDLPWVLRLMCGLSQAIFIVKFIAFCILNLNAMGETCCIPTSSISTSGQSITRRASVTKLPFGRGAVGSPQIPRKASSSSLATTSTTTTRGNRQLETPSEVSFIYGTSPIRPKYNSVNYSRRVVISQSKQQQQQHLDNPPDPPSPQILPHPDDADFEDDSDESESEKEENERKTTYPQPIPTESITSETSTISRSASSPIRR